MSYIGSDTKSSLVDPGTLFPAFSGATSGYIKFANGFIFQWGKVSLTSSSGQSITWPVAFPTACFRAMGHRTDGINQTANICGTSDPGTTSWTNIDTAATGSYSWFAVGI